MGVLDIFRKKHIAKKEESSSYYAAAKALGGAHEIVATLWGEEGVKKVVAHCAEDINSLITEGGISRKTDLLLGGLEICLGLFLNAKQDSQTTLGINSITAFMYYRCFFECVLALDSDIKDISELYTIFQATKHLHPGVHPYLQTMIKIYDLLDRGIIYLHKNIDTISEDYFSIVAKRIRNFLNAYTDDNTDWNKIAP